ncbi:hypothetical protein IFM58399_04030 [Aspergillus lentulus]|uniref:Uncharacterized protein n=1 Tax=Aspergillus lentulus TaxID=293939 RepID=A0ABQ1ANJ7_ASPLE|nr:uncharacterized protein IFM58399_04030 [Aspergillus lentulus]GFF34905.1 hypothetical protein IFM58399_04030 [Aspergillus lentulus]GFF63473.1 hypothetical protein IFM62136_05651 [Aspergillus lentulus]GFF85177.1 hypothetical protein IFM60648_07281 [Aspergillus lentulus]GFG10960.1 hypothetical protein IFM61392_06665 [Aspergillus lentulus]
MCYYMPNKPPCTCTYLQLIQPCPRVRVFAVPGSSTPLIQACPIRYIARGVGQRFCALCSRAAAFGGRTTNAAVGLVGYPEQQGFGGSQLETPSHQSQQQVTPIDPCLVGGGIPIGNLLLPMGEESTGELETAGEVGRRDEAGLSAQGSCSSELSIQSLLVQDESGKGLVADGEVGEVRTIQAAPVVYEEGSNGENEEVRVNRKEGKAEDHTREVGRPDPEGKATVQSMQIVLDPDEKTSESR